MKPGKTIMGTLAVVRDKGRKPRGGPRPLPMLSNPPSTAAIDEDRLVAEIAALKAISGGANLGVKRRRN